MITISRDDVSSAFAHSLNAGNEFPKFDVNLKRAVSLARFVRDPLAVSDRPFGHL